MRKDGEDWAAFLARLNEGLTTLGSGGRVRATGCDETLVAIVDLDGKPIGVIPAVFDAPLIAAFLLIVERTFEEGVGVGERRARANGASQ